jgi:endo-1,4-beta-xylanase
MTLIRKTLSRRSLLSVWSAAATSCLLSKNANDASLWRASYENSPNTSSLKEAAASRGLLYGSCGGFRRLSTEATYRAAFAKQCGVLVPESELQWDNLCPAPGIYNFAPADWLLGFAQQKKIKFRGHPLEWTKAFPRWFDSTATPQNATSTFQSLISTVVSHYSGQTHSWDVINEALAPEDKRADGLGNTVLLRLLGPEYIQTAFHTAAAADPSAMLVWNENLIEQESPFAEARRSFFLKNLRDLVKRNVPIHAIGIQSHLPGDAPNIAGPRFQDFLREVSDLGLRILVTEMDVRDDNLPADVATRDQMVADKYYQYLSVVLKQESVVAVITWGLSDHWTSVATYHPRKDHVPVRPLPLDYDMNPSPAFYAIARAFQEAPRR